MVFGGLEVRWTWQSIIPGITVSPEASITWAPFGMPPDSRTSVMVSSSMMTTAPRTGSRPLPSMSLPHWIARVIHPPDWPSCYQVAPLGFGEPAGALA